MKKWRLANLEKVKEYEKRYTKQRHQYRLKHREKYKAYNRQYRKDNAEQLRQYSKVNSGIHRNNLLKRKYGITTNEYDDMFLRQNGKCDSCQSPQKDFKRRFHVDHNHSTGKIRGLLCVKCNYLAGLYEQNPNCLDQIKSYVEKYSSS